MTVTGYLILGIFLGLTMIAAGMGLVTQRSRYTDRWILMVSLAELMWLGVSIYMIISHPFGRLLIIPVFYIAHSLSATLLSINLSKSLKQSQSLSDLNHVIPSWYSTYYLVIALLYTLACFIGLNSFR